MREKAKREKREGDKAQSKRNQKRRGSRAHRCYRATFWVFPLLGAARSGKGIRSLAHTLSFILPTLVSLSCVNSIFIFLYAYFYCVWENALLR